jgi:hypothetical protein
MEMNLRKKTLTSIYVLSVDKYDNKHSYSNFWFPSIGAYLGTTIGLSNLFSINIQLALARAMA